MKDHTGDLKQFIHAKRAWYADTALRNMDFVDYVNFGFFSPDGGTSGEMKVAWYPIGGKDTPKLECFDDAWHSLAQFHELIDLMADTEDNVTPAEFCRILEQCGFTDATPIRYDDSYRR